MNPTFYTAAELARKLRRQPRTLARLRERCGLPSWRPDGEKSYLYPVAETDAWIAQWKVTLPVIERKRRSDAGVEIAVVGRKRTARRSASGRLTRRVFIA